MVHILHSIPARRINFTRKRVSALARTSFGVACLLMAGVGAAAGLFHLAMRGRRTQNDEENESQTLMIKMPQPSEDAFKGLREESCWASSPDLSVHVMPLNLESCNARLKELLGGIALDADDADANGSLLSDGTAFFGLDCEWEPESSSASCPHRVSVIQLSSLKHCMVFRPLHMTAGMINPIDSGVPCDVPSTDKQRGDQAAGSPKHPESRAVPSTDDQLQADPSSPAGKGLVPQKLRDLLEDPSVIKAGVGIQEDVRRLKRDLGIQVKVRRRPPGLLFNHGPTLCSLSSLSPSSLPIAGRARASPRRPGLGPTPR